MVIIMENINTYSKKERNMFLTGMFGQNMIYNVVTVGLYYYFQNVICLPAIAFGWIFAIARIWDAINDPMMGSIVDKTRTNGVNADLISFFHLLLYALLR